MQRRHIIPLALALTVALSACQIDRPQVAPPPTIAAPLAPAPITAARAVALLDATCGASLPQFGTIDAALRASGITRPNQTELAEDVSIRIQDGPGDGKTCAMTFASAEGPDAVKAALTALGTFKDTPLGLATRYRGRPAILIYDGPGQQIGAVHYYALRLLSER